MSHYFHAQLSEQFDAMLHIDHTRALEPLETTAGWHAGEVPETYPTGICMSENWLNLETLPEHIICIGGGYVGLEMGQFFRRLGSRVTIVQSDSQLLPHEDVDVSEALYNLLAAEGIEIRIDSEVTSVAKSASRVTVNVKSGDHTAQVEGSDIFLAVGRKPNTDDLGLESVGVRTDEHGIIEVDAHLATSVKGIWAAGDIRGGPMFTHTSWDDYRTLASQLLADGSRLRSTVVPYAVFTDPELGRVGMTEREARERGIDVAIGKFAIENNSRAEETNEPDGFIKLVVDKDTKRILGASVLSANGAELVHVYEALMLAEAPYTVLQESMAIHPTFAEALQSAAMSIE